MKTAVDIAYEGYNLYLLWDRWQAGDITTTEFAGLVAKQAAVYGAGYVGRALGGLIDVTYGCGGMCKNQ